MHSHTARQLRRLCGYQPGKTLVEYEQPKLHRIARVPTFEKHTRIVRSWDPKLKQIVSKSVEKVIVGRDGRTPLWPIMALVKDPATGKQTHVNQVEPFPVQAPIRLKADSPKALYRAAKREARRAA